MKKTYFIISFQSMILILLFLGCTQITAFDVAPEITKALDACDEQQKYINMAIIPECYLSIFKQNNWSEQKVKKYIQFRLKINIDEITKESGAWQDAWSKYYVVKNDESVLSVEQYKSLTKEYQKEYSVFGFISELDTSCFCPKDLECSICSPMPYLVLTDYKVEVHGVKYELDKLQKNELYVPLIDVNDISSLILDKNYTMKVRFVDENRSYLISYTK